MGPEDAEPGIRASDAERDAVVSRLNVAAADGRLTFEELSDRTGAALAARTREQLAALTADLPQEERTAPAPAPAPVPPAPIRGQRQSSLLGHVKRAGRWTVEAHSTWSSVFGNVTLDLREARVSAAEIVIHARSVFGNVDVLVPEGVHVVVEAHSTLGQVKQETRDDAGPGAPRVIVRGGTTFGRVRVRNQRLHERLLPWLSS